MCRWNEVDIETDIRKLTFSQNSNELRKLSKSNDWKAR